jgi:hypothetical protein
MMKECLVAVEDSRGKRVLLFVLRNGGTQIERVLVKCKRAGCAMIEVPLPTAVHDPFSADDWDCLTELSRVASAILLFNMNNAGIAWRCPYPAIYDSLKHINITGDLHLGFLNPLLSPEKAAIYYRDSINCLPACLPEKNERFFLVL